MTYTSDHLDQIRNTWKVFIKLCIQILFTFSYAIVLHYYDKLIE